MRVGSGRESSVRLRSDLAFIDGSAIKSLSDSDRFRRLRVRFGVRCLRPEPLVLVTDAMELREPRWRLPERLESWSPSMGRRSIRLLRGRTGVMFRLMTLASAGTFAATRAMAVIADRSAPLALTRIFTGSLLGWLPWVELSAFFLALSSTCKISLCFTVSLSFCTSESLITSTDLVRFSVFRVDFF